MTTENTEVSDQPMRGDQIWEIAEKITGRPRDMTAAFLLASIQVGTSVERVRKLIGIRQSDARDLAKKAIAAGLWVDDKVAGAEWFEENGGTALIMDCLVLEGLLELVHDRRK